MKDVLYISYDGMTDPLGQSQVIPYMRGLAAKGHRITLLSCEKGAHFAELEGHTRRLLADAGIDWHHVPYTKRPPVVSTGWDLARMYRLGARLATERSFDIVHGRTILSTLVGARLRRRFGMKLVFDTRALWTEDRVEGGLWDLDNPVYAGLYRWFKGRELEYYGSADLVFTLTRRAREHVHAVRQGGAGGPPVHVVPCCADLHHFDPGRLDPREVAARREGLGVEPDDFVLSYLGSLGTRYLLREMMDFFGTLRRQEPRARFLFITRSEHEAIRATAAALGIPQEALILAPTVYAEVPELVALSRASVFFIKTGISGKAVSPVKQAELMGMGLRIVCNSGIGDCDEIIGASGAGIVLDRLGPEAYRKAAAQLMDAAPLGPEGIRTVAARHLSLERGVELYHGAWESLGTPAGGGHP